MSSDRRRPPNAWIRWDRIEPDYCGGLPPEICARRENERLEAEGDKRRVPSKLIRNMAYLKGWKQSATLLHWHNGKPCHGVT